MFFHRREHKINNAEPNPFDSESSSDSDSETLSCTLRQ